MAEQNRPHILVIQQDPKVLDWPQREATFTIECPGVTDTCRSYLECGVEGCDSETLAMNDGVAHKVEHRMVGDGWWGVPTEECFMAGHSEIREAARDLGLLVPGRYPVEQVFERYDDPDILRLALAGGGSRPSVVNARPAGGAS